MANEAVLNIRTVRACGAEREILQRFTSKLAEITAEKTGTCGSGSLKVC